MPLDHAIDHAARLIQTRAHGILTSEEIWDYQRTVDSRPELKGYNEIIDMTDVQVMPAAPREKLRALAQTSSALDAPDKPCRLAIVAPTDLSFAIGRQFETLRNLMPTSHKPARTFRSRAEAMVWLASALEMEA